MRRFLRMSALVAMLLAPAAAPVAAQSMLSVRIGPSLAKFGGDSPGQYIKYSMHTGVSATVSLSVPFGHRLGLETGIGYVSKGTKRTYANGADVSLDYFEIPILLDLSLTRTRGMSILVGPTVAFKARCEINASPYGGPCDEATAFYVHTKGTDVGLATGVRFENRGSRRVRMVLEALYETSLQSIDRDGGNLRNRAFVIQVGMGFPLHWSL